MKARGLARLWAERDSRYALTTRDRLTPEQIDAVRSFRANEAMLVSDQELAAEARAWNPPAAAR